VDKCYLGPRAAFEGILLMWDRRIVENVSRIDTSLCAELTHILPYLV
jgi:hypothetical protein